MLTDFDKGEELPNKFGGSEAKTTILLDGVRYMVKYLDPVRDDKNELYE
jgi:hypothetical protein